MATQNLGYDDVSTDGVLYRHVEASELAFGNSPLQDLVNEGRVNEERMFDGDSGHYSPALIDLMNTPHRAYSDKR